MSRLAVLFFMFSSVQTFAQTESTKKLMLNQQLSTALAYEIGERSKNPELKELEGQWECTVSYAGRSLKRASMYPSLQAMNFIVTKQKTVYEQYLNMDFAFMNNVWTNVKQLRKGIPESTCASTVRKSTTDNVLFLEKICSSSMDKTAFRPKGLEDNTDVDVKFFAACERPSKAI